MHLRTLTHDDIQLRNYNILWKLIKYREKKANHMCSFILTVQLFHHNFIFLVFSPAYFHRPFFSASIQCLFFRLTCDPNLIFNSNCLNTTSLGECLINARPYSKLTDTQQNGWHRIQVHAHRAPMACSISIFNFHISLALRYNHSPAFVSLFKWVFTMANSFNYPINERKLSPSLVYCSFHRGRKKRLQ